MFDMTDAELRAALKPERKKKAPARRRRTPARRRTRREGRPRPPVSATHFRVGHTEVGGDDHIWEVTKTKNNVKRWKRAWG